MRPKDRLAELQRAANAASGGTLQAAAAPTPAPRDDTDMHHHIELILQEAERMHKWIHEVNTNTQLIRRLHADPTFHSNQHLQEQLDASVARAHEAARQLGAALRRFECGGGGDARARIARLQRACARRRLADALQLHHAALDALRAERRRLLRDQIQLTNLSLSEEECESLLDSRNLSLFVDNVRAETASARAALRDAEARRDELARLEAALRDVRDLFANLALLVAAQQERVDSVEYYALQATEHVESGQQQLLRGTVTRTKARKKKVSLIICLSTGFLVVLLVLVFT